MAAVGDAGLTPDDLSEQVAQSRFLAARERRPPSTELRDPRQVRAILVGLCRAARQEFLQLHDWRAPDADRPLLERRETVEILDRAMLGRGVDLRLLHTYGGLEHPGEPEYLSRAHTAGAQVRLTVTAPLKLTLVDRHTALLPLEPQLRTLHHGALLVRDPVLVHALRTTYTALWAASRPRTYAGLDAPPAYLLPVLDLLLSGLTDAAAARRLNLAPRTYARRVTQLLDLLGATSRAQAGVEAHRRGWCP
jgi:DNA-binding CsgD family transcriptional regulator